MDTQVFRVEKIKAAGTVQKRAQHNTRETAPPNANPDRDNEIGYAQSSEQAMAMWREDLPEKYRKDSVLAGEVVVSASHGWFMDVPRETQDAYFRDALNWLTERHGEENIVSVAIHRDEWTPHMHVLFTPTAEREDGSKTLRWSDHYGGKKALAQAHSEFHRDVSSKYSLDRGQFGSKAEHTTTAAYQGWVNEVARGAGEAWANYSPDAARIKQFRAEGMNRKQAELRAAHEAGYAQKNMPVMDAMMRLRASTNLVQEVEKRDQVIAEKDAKYRELHSAALSIKDERDKLLGENRDLREQLQNATFRIKAQREANIWAVNRLKDIDYEKTSEDKNARTQFALRQIRQADINSPAYLRELQSTDGNWEKPGTPEGAPLLPHQQKALDMARGMRRDADRGR